MATEKRVSEVVTAPAAVVAETFELTLNEFCLRLSTEKVGPEMIAGFNYDQLSKGVVKASSAGFKAAFGRFACQPA